VAGLQQYSSVLVISYFCAKQGPTFTDHECKPLRSDYTADLSDENLAKNNVPQPSGSLLKARKLRFYIFL
jgi:hypothetical protein